MAWGKNSGERGQRRAGNPETFLTTPPNRVCVTTASGGWYTRAWRPGEKEEYVKQIAWKWGKRVY